MPGAGLQAPFKATCFVSSGARSPLAPLAYLTAFSTLHAVVQRRKPFRTLLEAAGFVQVKARLALCAVLFTEAGLTVVYPAP